MLNFLKCLLQLILSPGRGWEDISHEGLERRELMSSGLLPLITITAMSVFVTMLYHDGPALTEAVIGAVIIMVSLVSSFYIACFVIPLMVPDCIGGESCYNDKRTSTFIIYSTALVALTILIINLLPVEVGVAYFMPLYVAIIMWKGSRYMGVQSARQPHFVLLAIASILAPPYLLIWLFRLLA